MTEIDLATIDDKQIAKRVSELFNTSKDKIGNLMAEEILETLEYASIYQPTTRSISATGIHKNIRMGEVYTKHGVLGNKLAVMPLVMWNSQSYYDRNKNEQICNSPNGITPVHTKLSTKCATCRFKKFSKGSPSLCTKFLNILMLPEDLKMKPIVLQFSRTNFRVGSDIAKQAQAVGDNLFDNVFELTTEQATGAAYFKWKVDSVRETPDKLKPALLEIQKHYFELVTNTISRHEVSASDEPEEQEIDAPENVE